MISGRPPTVIHPHSSGLNLTHGYREALGFCKVPKTGVILLLGVRQVGLLGPFLWQECHKRRKAKAENKKNKKKGKARGRGKVLKVYASQHFSCPAS